MSPDLETLETSFKNIAKACSQSENTPNDETLSRWWERITSAYSEPQRYYHTMDHITSMWELYESTLKVANHDSGVVRFAIIFHDIVYDPTAPFSENEKNSIRVWEEFANETSLLPNLTEGVSKLIDATIRHAVESDSPDVTPEFLDLDLEVLARPRDRYIRYASQIRKEYAHYSDENYCKGRIGVLRRLNSGHIYFTEYWRQRLTTSARDNLTWEIDSLTAARIPNMDNES